MKQAIQRPQPRPPAPVKVEMIWCFYVNGVATTFLLWNHDEKLVESERQGCIAKRGDDSVSELMKKPANHLAAIGSRPDHKLIQIGVG